MKPALFTAVIVSVLAWTSLAGSSEKTEAPAAAPKKTVATDKPVPKSSFSVPAKPADGHDPFFPASDRLFAVKTKPKTSTPSNNSAIVFNGISGTDDHRFAMINGHTFAEGEKASVNTSGGRVPVQLIAIRGDIAVVEVAGERRELKFQDP